ncbi:hypothetical protein GWK47_034237 [Chionoecetes opilio]|uniref:Uncharacterized protein n=1 Tax=Chionoecetes opilio TaxID=41210 RepID=A0A8J5D0T8_CHIOP|nr:hypothetical protein GWK47_034237 [Chionoecetes opilio]
MGPPQLAELPPQPTGRPSHSTPAAPNIDHQVGLYPLRGTEKLNPRSFFTPLWSTLEKTLGRQTGNPHLTNSMHAFKSGVNAWLQAAPMSCAGRPEAPTSCSVVKKTYDSLVVTCAAAFDGGLQQSFSARVFESVTGMGQVNVTSHLPHFTFDGLTPGLDYLIEGWRTTSSGPRTPSPGGLSGDPPITRTKLAGGQSRLGRSRETRCKKTTLEHHFSQCFGDTKRKNIPHFTLLELQKKYSQPGFYMPSPG